MGTLDSQRLLQKNGTPVHVTVRFGTKNERLFSVKDSQADQAKSRYSDTADNPRKNHDAPITPPEAFEPFGGRGKCEPIPSTPEDAYHPPRVTIYDDAEKVPSTPEDAKIVDSGKLKGQETDPRRQWKVLCL